MTAGPADQRATAVAATKAAASTTSRLGLGSWRCAQLHDESMESRKITNPTIISKLDCYYEEKTNIYAAGKHLINYIDFKRQEAK
jgi:hypothetical protein